MFITALNGLLQTTAEYILYVYNGQIIFQSCGVITSPIMKSYTMGIVYDEIKCILYYMCIIYTYYTKCEYIVSVL
jgi:hypothetical protein